MDSGGGGDAAAASRASLGEAKLSLALALAFALATAWSVDRVGWMEGTRVLLPLAGAGVVAGALLGRTRLPAWLAVLAGLLLGALAAFVAVGQLLPSPALVMGAPAPLVALLRPAQQVGGDAVAFAQRITQWATAAGAGGGSTDNAIFLLVLTWVAWVQGMLVALAVLRARDPVLAVLPAGVILIVQAFAVRSAVVPFVVLLGGCLLLAASLHLEAMQRRWERLAIDYPAALKPELFAVATVLVCGAGLVARFSPYPTVTPVAAALQWYLGDRWYDATARVDQLFSGIDGQANLTATAGGGSMTLSERGQTRLTDREVMRVKVVSAPVGTLREDRPGGWLEALPDELRYWRGIAYDTYTGRAWRNSDAVRLPPGQDAEGAAYAPTGRTSTVVLGFTLPPGKSDLLYAPADPLRLSIPYLLQTRNRDLAAIDHSALRATGSAARGRSYEVDVPATTPSADELRRAPAAAPAWAGRYLQVPDLAQRVRDLATATATSAPTPYDRTLAVERMLRALPVAAQPVLVPLDKETVEQVLFEAHSGSAEQLSTAMIVLLRAQGIPARLTSGYVAGRYNSEAGAVVVTERDAHAWPEVYFNGIGWVPFEPAGNRPAIERPETGPAPEDACAGTVVAAYFDPTASDPGLGLGSLPGELDPCGLGAGWGAEANPAATAAGGSATAESVASAKRGPAGKLAAPAALGTLALAGAGVAGYSVLATQRARRRAPADRVRRTYGRLLRWSTVAGLKRRPAETPLEYAARLERVQGACAAPAGAGAAGGGPLDALGQRLARRLVSPPAGEAVAIAGAYVRACYGQHQVSEADAERVEADWTRLRRQLPLLSLASRRPARFG